MTETEAKSTCTVRVTVRLRPSEYDELYRQVHEIGSTMSAFFRESAVKAMKGGVGMNLKNSSWPPTRPLWTVPKLQHPLTPEKQRRCGTQEPSRWLF